LGNEAVSASFRPARLLQLCVIGLLDSREITGNVLIQQERFSFQSGENGCEIKVAE
jgi:hypothetical protein